MAGHRFLARYFSDRPQLSLRNRFGLGLGAMLMPFFVLIGSTYMFFEHAISNFEIAESKNLEERFSIAELKTHFSEARPNVNLLLIQPEKTERLEKLRKTHTKIVKEITGILARSPSPYQANLLARIGNSWENVYTTIQDPSVLAKLNDDKIDKLTKSELLDQIQKDLELVQQGLDGIDVILWNIQFGETQKRARQLKEQARLWIGLMTLFAISIAVLSAIFLSRSVIQSMQTLIQGLEKLSEGDLDERIEWHSDDEFGRVANAINAMAEKLAQSQQALIEIATVDGLTGILNRREFNRLLTVEIERSRRDHHPVSMAMVDIDHFKSINDTYGHQSGDDALQWVAALLKQEIRPGDIVARYGGEEFALILPNTNGEDASIVAERIRDRMANSMIPIQKGLTIAVTASLGCATFPYIGDSEELLINAADKALYRAKETGRNRVCHAPNDWDGQEQTVMAKQSA